MMNDNTINNEQDLNIDEDSSLVSDLYDLLQI